MKGLSVRSSVTVVSLAFSLLTAWIRKLWFL